MTTYVRVDTKFPGHPKVLDIGPLGEALWLRGLCYAGEQLTDGFVPLTFLKRMSDMKAIRVAAKLVAAGLWIEADGGYRIHGYLDWQRSREQVEDIAGKRAEAGRLGGKQKASNLLDSRLANPLANPKQTPSTVTIYTEAEAKTETETETKAEIPATPEASVPSAPIAPPPKPRTEKQRKADAIYERRLPIVEAFFRGLGIERDTLAWNQRFGPSLKALTPAILDSPECSPEIVESLARYTATAYQWRQGRSTPSLAEVLTAFPEWDAAGRPDKPPGKVVSLNGHAPRLTVAEKNKLVFEKLIREAEAQRAGGDVIEANGRVTR